MLYYIHHNTSELSAEISTFPGIVKLIELNWEKLNLAMRNVCLISKSILEKGKYIINCSYVSAYNQKIIKLILPTAILKEIRERGIENPNIKQVKMQ
jgi:hypothetical protein